MTDHEAYLAWWGKLGVDQPRVTNEQTWHAGVAHERERFKKLADELLEMIDTNNMYLRVKVLEYCTGLDAAREGK